MITGGLTPGGRLRLIRRVLGQIPVTDAGPHTALLAAALRELDMMADDLDATRPATFSNTPYPDEDGPDFDDGAHIDDIDQRPCDGPTFDDGPLARSKRHSRRRGVR